MSNIEYQKRQKARDIHEKHKRKEDVVVPLEEVFFLLTRNGVDAFTGMFENSIRNVVAEEVDKAFRSVADGIREGLAGIISGTVAEAVKQEAAVTEEIREVIDRAVQKADDLDKEMTLMDWGQFKEDFEEEVKAVTPREALEDALRDTSWSLYANDHPEVNAPDDESRRFRLFKEYCEDCGNAKKLCSCKQDPEPTEPAKKHSRWTDEEDGLLINAIIIGLQEGKTRTAVFKEMAEELNRTEAAVQYRWNSKFAALYKETK